MLPNKSLQLCQEQMIRAIASKFFFAFLTELGNSKQRSFWRQCHWQCCQTKVCSIAKSRWFGPISTVTLQYDFSKWIPSRLVYLACYQIQIWRIFIWSYFNTSWINSWTAKKKISINSEIHILLESHHKNHHRQICVKKKKRLPWPFPMIFVPTKMRKVVK